MFNILDIYIGLCKCIQTNVECIREY